MHDRISMYVPMTDESGNPLPEVHIRYKYVDSSGDCLKYESEEGHMPFFITMDVLEDFIAKGWVTIL